VIEIKEHVEGIAIPVRAQPNAKKVGVQGEQAGALKVAVSAPPEDGKANDAIAEVLKDFFGVKRSQVELISGRTHRNKIFLLRDCSPDHVQSRLATLS
jgi:uncharacterized protein (TIGR00251 family)